MFYLFHPSRPEHWTEPRIPEADSIPSGTIGYSTWTNSWTRSYTMEFVELGGARHLWGTIELHKVPKEYLLYVLVCTGES